jgi:hypothetical protein
MAIESSIGGAILRRSNDYIPIPNMRTLQEQMQGCHAYTFYNVENTGFCSAFPQLKSGAADDTNVAIHVAMR